MAKRQTVVNLPYGFVPRGYQWALWDARLNRDVKRLFWCVHRRAGKDLTCWNIMLAEAMKRVGNYLYLLPTKKQAVDIIWMGKDKMGRPFLDYIPPELIRRKSEVENRIELVNGSLISLEGTDKVDRLVGQGPVGVVFSEFQLQTEDAWDYIRPMLVESGGWAIFNGTARPVSEAPHFKGMYDMALGNDEWFCELLGADKTGAVTEEEIQIEREAGMDEAKIRQEFYCDFYASSENILIPLSLIESAYDRVVSYHYTPKVAGIDIGLSLGGDPSALVIRQGGIILCLDELRSDNFDVIAGWARDRLHEFGCMDVAIDGIGWGAGLKIPLQNMGFNVMAVNVAEAAANKEMYSRKRDELWFAGREWFYQKQCCIPSRLKYFQKFVAELSSVTYDTNRVTGKRKVQSKKDMKKSPNLADAFCLTFAVLPNWENAGVIQRDFFYSDSPRRAMLL